MITSDAVVASDYDYMVIKNIYGETMAYTTSNKLWNVNYFNQTSKDLIAKGYEESQAKGQIYEQCVAFVESQFKTQERENPKYELLSDDTVTVNNITLRRIRALKDVGTIKKGTLGGYIESDNNLSHSGTAWVHDTAKVFGDALVTDDAQIHGDTIIKDKALVENDAFVTDNAIIQDHASVSDSAIVRDNARIYNNASVYDNALIQDKASISGNAQIYGNAAITGTSQVTDNALVYDKATLRGNVIVTGNAQIKGNANLYDHVRISEHARIYRDATLRNKVHVSGFAHVTTSLDGNETITGDAIVDSPNDVFCIKSNDADDNSHFPENNYITYTKSNDMWYHNKFYGNSREFLRSAKTSNQRRFYKQLLKLIGKHPLFL